MPGPLSSPAKQTRNKENQQGIELTGKREPTNMYHERTVSTAQVLEPKWHSTGHAHRSKFVPMTSKLDMQHKLCICNACGEGSEVTPEHFHRRPATGDDGCARPPLHLKQNPR